MSRGDDSAYPLPVEAGDLADAGMGGMTIRERFAVDIYCCVRQWYGPDDARPKAIAETDALLAQLDAEKPE